MIRLFRVLMPLGSLILFLCEAVLVTSSFVLASYLTMEVDPTVYLLYDRGLTRILLVTASVLIGMHLQDLYSRIRIKSRFRLLQDLCLTMGIAYLAQGLISYVSRDLRTPIRLMVPGSAIAIVVIFAWRNLYSGFVLRSMGAQRILFVGRTPVIEAIAAHVERHTELGLAVAGYVEDELAPGTWRGGGKVLGPMESLRQIAASVRPDRIVVGLTERRHRMPLTDLLELRFAGFIIEEASAAYESLCMRISTLELRPSQLVFSGELGPRPGTLLLQDLYNMVLAFVGSLLFLPLMLLVAIAVKLSSPGPILYRQTRVGQSSKLFTVYKFRSMYVDAEAATGPIWAAKDDPRVTPVGRILRKLRLDELPQFFNVLKGDMSLVGPRPERPEFVKILGERIPYYKQRHCIKPGITGWAQINYKYGDTLEDSITKLEYDLYYIKNVSFSLDAYIITQTLKAMLISRGSQ